MTTLVQQQAPILGLDGKDDMEILLPNREEFVIGKELLQEFIEIAHDVSLNQEIQVLIGKPNQGSLKLLHTNYIIVDPLMVKENPGQGRFVTGHEASHDAISRSMIELGISPAQSELLYSKLGYAFIHNIVEDPAVNDFMCLRRPDLREEVRRFYDKAFSKQNTVMAAGPISALISELGYVPKFVQFASELIRYWHTQTFSDQLDPDVTLSLMQVRRSVLKAIQTIPSKDTTDESTIKEKARIRFLLVHEYVWPEIEKLIKLDIDNERRRQQAQAALNESDPSNSTTHSTTDSQGGSGTPSSTEVPSKSDSSQSISDPTLDEIRRNARHSKGENSGPSIDPSDLSPEAQSELDEIFENLPDEEKKKLLARATTRIKTLEDKANAALNPRAHEKEPRSNNGN
ncbi:MAG: hypothetical protein KDD42_08580, partial [Bdellovibrionales bacterium]|nr:hypothetical protein [Bdellovibrionales bacterium]